MAKRTVEEERWKAIEAALSATERAARESLEALGTGGT